MMKAESSPSLLSSSINPTLDEQRLKSAPNNVSLSSSSSKSTTITVATKIASSVKRSSKFLPSILSPANLSLPPSQSLPSNRLLSTTTNTNIITNSSSTCISPSSSLPAATSTTATNVFTNNFPPSSCCCRQMMTTSTISGNTMMNPKTASTATPLTTASTIASNCNNSSSSTTSSSSSSSSSSCKKSLKSGNDYDWCFGRVCSRIQSSKLFRQLLPISLCILSFATVLSILIVYMDTTEIRHQQFKLNMSRDYELYGVPQDDPTLIAFLREIHMKKYPMNFLKNTPIEHYNFTENHELTPEMAKYIGKLVNNKMNGIFIQSMTGSTSQTMTAPWLAETLNWSGLLIEPEPRRYFSLRKQNAHRQKVQVVHACLSPSGYPKEVRIHNDEDSDVRINSLIDDEPSWFNSRVKCFPLYTLMLAINKIDYDLLSLGCPDHELQILQTLPFNKVNIEVISIHLTDNRENVTEYIRNITKFLLGKSYKFQKKFLNNYIYQKINSNSTNKLRNRKQSRAISSSSFSSSTRTISNKQQQQIKTTTSQTTIMTKDTPKINQQKSQ